MLSPGSGSNEQLEDVARFVRLLAIIALCPPTNSETLLDVECGQKPKSPRYSLSLGLDPVHKWQFFWRKETRKPTVLGKYSVDIHRLAREQQC